MELELIVQRVCFTHDRCPGDVTVMTAMIRDLALQYREQFEIHVATTCLPLWDNNPYVAHVHKKAPQGMYKVDITYGPYISTATQDKLHFITAMHRLVASKLQLELPVLYPYGDLHLTEEEKATPPVNGRYWYVIAGGKMDFTVKLWSAVNWIRTAQLLQERGISIVQGA